MPSINTPSFLWVGSAVFELRIINAPAKISHDLVFFCWLEVGIFRLFSLVISECVLNLFELKAVEGFDELFLDSNV